ncbi:ComF family protein [Cupriavidus sp. 30B13]|uniref:ComF family protein n=1 Tax=Cupriavidus sp. 30B13 TaxID=3384241 RepID=UPI003B92125B
MQGHGQARQQENEEHGRTQAPGRNAARTPAGAAAGPQVYARAAAAAGARPAEGALRRHARRLWRALLPSACALCGEVQEDAVCAGCARELLAPAARCRSCARPTPRHGSLCNHCRLEPPAFDAALALGDYASPQDGLVLALKFGGALPLADWLAAALADRWHATRGVPRAEPGLRGLPDLPHLLAPVPLSAQRLAARGFNQSWEIARPLARRLGVRAQPALLARLRDTPAQASLDLPARQANLQGAFGLAPGNDVAGLHVGLVDDVMTSGATLGEAARVLKAHGAARVTLFVPLRTP